jgi:SAM-dependent methyltransferase
MALGPLMVLTILVIAYVIASIFLPLLTGGAGYTPTPRRAVDEALAIADLKKDEVFYDLGCGAGGVLLRALRRCDDVRGIEIEPLRWLVARLRARGARVILGDLFKQDISDADVIFMFQYRGRINDRIARKIRSEVRPGTRVVSYLHAIEGMRLVRKRSDIFVYEA